MLGCLHTARFFSLLHAPQLSRSFFFSLLTSCWTFRDYDFWFRPIKYSFVYPKHFYSISPKKIHAQINSKNWFNTIIHVIKWFVVIFSQSLFNSSNIIAKELDENMSFVLLSSIQCFIQWSVVRTKGTIFGCLIPSLSFSLWHFLRKSYAAEKRMLQQF